jgi:L-lactate dehydrogenase complex protein LldG
MSDANREAILERIRRALATPAPAPHFLEGGVVPAGPLFPLPAPTGPGLRNRFRSEFEAVLGEFHEFESLAAAQGWLGGFVAGLNEGSVLAADVPALRRLASGLEGVAWISQGGSAGDWESFGVGLTTCESLVAESGTIVVSAASSGRAASVLPPIHIVAATTDQLVPDLSEALARLRRKYAEGLPSSATFVTGPSRTADIEKILVVGAHGPKRLLLMLLPEGAL